MWHTTAGKCAAVHSTLAAVVARHKTLMHTHSSVNMIRQVCLNYMHILNSSTHMLDTYHTLGRIDTQLHTGLVRPHAYILCRGYRCVLSMRCLVMVHFDFEGEGEGRRDPAGNLIILHECMCMGTNWNVCAT